MTARRKPRPTVFATASAAAAPFEPAAPPVVLDPPKATKLAILGSAPSSRMLAPFHDPAWDIWACSPANSMGQLPRVTAWFELHAPAAIRAPENWPSHKEYVGWLNEQPFDVFMKEENSLVPKAQAFPWVTLVKKYGPHFFTSSIAWMMAWAIEGMLAEREEHPELAEHQAIKLCGVDMAANGEFEAQRGGCHHFMAECARLGIKLDVPFESDLWRPPPLYAIMEGSPMQRKLSLHGMELNQRHEQARGQYAAAEREMFMIQGATAELGYIMRTWLD